MIRAANLLTEGRRVPGMAGSSVISPSWAPVAKRIRDEATDNWDDKVAADRFTEPRRDARSRTWQDHRARRGHGRRGRPAGHARDRHRHRHRARHPAHRWPGRDPVLDQPRGHRDGGRTAVAADPGRRRDRRRAGPGVRQVRQRRDHGGGDAAAAAAGGAGVRRAHREGLPGRGHHGEHGNRGRVGSPRRPRVHGDARRRQTVLRGAPARGDGAQERPGGTRGRQHRARRDGPVHHRRRADAGRSRSMGARGRRRQGRLHAHVDVSGPHHPRRAARPSSPSGRVSRGAAGHLH